jgi:phosphoglycolate phosphatase-like HAD superfamily hydrolase
LLLLFDIDGTLVRSAPVNHKVALTEATTEVFGLRVDPGQTPVDDAEPWGKTDRQILRDVLARAGLDPNPTERQVADWERAACRVYERLEQPGANHDDGTAPTAAALRRLRDAGHTLALVTGNLEPIARRKLGLRGLGEFFAPGQGGFGSDADLRPELVPIARARAGTRAAPHPRGDTLVIGDTPDDVAAAQADGVRCIGVAGHRFDRDHLLGAGAVAVVDHVPEVERLLPELARSG